MQSQRRQKIRSTQSRELKNCNRNLTNLRSSRGMIQRIIRTTWNLQLIAWMWPLLQTLKLQEFIFCRVRMMRGLRTFIQEVSNRHRTLQIISQNLMRNFRQKKGKSVLYVAQKHSESTWISARRNTTSLWPINDRYSKREWCRDGPQLLLTGSNSRYL